MHVYLSTNPEGDVFGREEPLPHFVWNDITFGNWNEARVIDLDVNLPKVRPHACTGDCCVDVVVVRVCSIMDRCGRTFSWLRTIPHQIRAPRDTTLSLCIILVNVCD